jgi:hypothetical protein
MTSTEPLLSSWQDEKVKPFLEDGDDDQQVERRAKARNPFNLVGSVILVLIALGIVRMIHVKIGYMLSNGKLIVCTHGGSDIPILNFKEVRTTFHSFTILMQNTCAYPLPYPLCQHSVQCPKAAMFHFLVLLSSILN